VPSGNACECDEEHEGTVRSCMAEGQQGAKCAGTQTCRRSPTGVFTWAPCQTTGTTDEVCDGKDNDCDGLVDEVFIDQNGSGTYDTDHHCGACNRDCTTQWNKDIQHAAGSCIVAPGRAPVCEIVQCTSDTVGGGGSCNRDGDCPVGWRCMAPYYQCSKACGSPGDCPSGAVCNDGWCTIACSTNATCTSKFGAPSACVDGVCKATYQFHNVDEADSNGCECPRLSTLASDEPDIYPAYPEAGWAFVDRNCDEVDGEASRALYVWEESAQSLGTAAHPFRTIGEALHAFKPSQHTHILVATGQYHETIQLAEGVQLFGGYAPDFTSRDIVGYPTLIVGPEPESAASAARGVVNAVGVKTKRTVVAGFAIYGFDVGKHAAPGQHGKSTYAVYLQDCSDKMVLANNLIFGGRGGDGGHGAAGQPGAAGGKGGDGLNSKECNTASCAGETQPGGGAGTNLACGGTHGNPGAGADGSMDTQAHAEPSGINGRGGTNATYSADSSPQFANLCKYDCVIGGDVNGLDAQAGANGQSGGGGVGCGTGLGSIVNSAGRPGPSAAGAAATPGRGGGGGGAGGCVVNRNRPSCTVGNRRGDLGATGGGGGAAGCGGGGGQAAGGGGGSFAVFVAFGSSPGALPAVFGNIIYVGEGGAGGDGAFGGHGGLGGPGGYGGVTTVVAWCGGYGGKGGRGGDGGPGGGAGGGCGGVAFGIAGNFIGTAAYDTRNAFVQPVGSSGGPGGAGGPSPAGGASNGSAGFNGASGVIHVY
jgi:hypothetical protein